MVGHKSDVLPAKSTAPIHRQGDTCGVSPGFVFALLGGEVIFTGSQQYMQTLTANNMFVTL